MDRIYSAMTDDKGQPKAAPCTPVDEKPSSQCVTARGVAAMSVGGFDIT
jgi:hypothetical protein